MLPRVEERDVEKIEEIIPWEVFTNEMACMVKENLLAPLLEVRTQMWGICVLVHSFQSYFGLQSLPVDRLPS